MNPFRFSRLLQAVRSIQFAASHPALFTAALNLGAGFHVVLFGSLTHERALAFVMLVLLIVCAHESYHLPRHIAAVKYALRVVLNLIAAASLFLSATCHSLEDVFPDVQKHWLAILFIAAFTASGDWFTEALRRSHSQVTKSLGAAVIRGIEEAAVAPLFLAGHPIGSIRINARCSESQIVPQFLVHIYDGDDKVLRLLCTLSPCGGFATGRIVNPPQCLVIVVQGTIPGQGVLRVSVHAVLYPMYKLPGGPDSNQPPAPAAPSLDFASALPPAATSATSVRPTIIVMPPTMIFPAALPGSDQQGSNSSTLQPGTKRDKKDRSQGFDVFE